MSTVETSCIADSYRLIIVLVLLQTLFERQVDIGQPVFQVLSYYHFLQ